MEISLKFSKITLLFILLFLFNDSLLASKANVLNYHAIIIAIDDYDVGNWTSLSSPVSDAKALKSVLKQKYGFSEVTTIFNKSATRTKILSEIEKKVNELSEEDNLLIYFSGHTKNFGTEAYWIPSDVKTDKIHELVPTNEIKNIIWRGKSKHILVMVDGLFNNTLMKSIDSSIQNDGTDIYYDQIEKINSRQILISGTNQPTISQNAENSVFAKCLLKYLDDNQKLIFDVGELYNYLKYPITANTPKAPVFGHIQDAGHEGGQFLFRLQVSENENDYATNTEVKVALTPLTIDILQGEQVLFKEKGTLNVAVAQYNDNLIFEWRKGNFTVGYGQSLEVTESGHYTVIVKHKNGQELGSEKTYVAVEYQRYVVQIGDNVERIAQKIYKDESAAYLIYDANPNIEKEAVLKVGSEIWIPSRKNSDANAESISIGTLETFAPLANPDSYNGGMLTDIVKTVYKEMKQDVNIEYFSGDKIKGVYTGITDLSFPFTKNKNDNLLYVYSEAIYTTSTVIFMNESKTTPEMKHIDKVIEIRRKEDRNTKMTIAVPVNFICDKLLEYSEKRYISLKTYSTTEACLEALKKNEVDFVTVPQIVGLVAIQNSPELNRLDYKILKKPLETTTLHLVVSKEHPEASILIEEFNTAYNTAKLSGTIDEIIKIHVERIQKKRED